MSTNETSDADPSRRKVMLVEDDEGVRRSLHLLLHWRGFTVCSFATIATLIDNAAPAADWLIADYHLPDGTGLGALRALRRAGWGGRAVLITGHPSAALREAAIAAGYETMLEKPLRHYELFGALG